MAADDLVMQGARVSAAMVLTYILWNILSPISWIAEIYSQGRQEHYIYIPFHTVSTMAADYLVMQGSRASVSWALM